VFGGLVLIAAVAHLSPGGFDVLSVIVMTARIFQTLTHTLLTETNRAVAIRFSFFFVQVMSMASMALMLALTAIRSLT